MSDTIPPMRRRADLEKIALVTCRSELEKVKAINVELLAALKEVVVDYEALLGDGMTAATEPPQLTAARAAIEKAERQS